MSIIGDYSPKQAMPLEHVLVRLGLLKGSAIIEGLDCVGKSTAATLLTSKTNRLLLTPQRKQEVPAILKPQYDSFTLGQYRTFIDLTEHMDVVLDRCHLSSYVFGGKSWAEVVYAEENAVDIKGLYLYAQPEVVRARMLAKGEPEELFKAYEAHRQRYEEVLKYTKINFIKVDTSLLTV